MVRMTPQDRRAAIVAAARAVAERKGLGGTTVRDVADEMGTSSGLIHHYFESMDDLTATVFEEVAESDLRRTIELMDAEDDPGARLATCLAAFSDPDNDEVHQLWLDAWSEAGRNPVMRSSSRRLNLEWQALFASTIQEGLDVGLYPSDDVDVEALAWKALSLLDGFSLQLIAHPTVLDRGQVGTWATELVERNLGVVPGSLGQRVEANR